MSVGYCFLVFTFSITTSSPTICLISNLKFTLNVMPSFQVCFLQMTKSLYLSDLPKFFLMVLLTHLNILFVYAMSAMLCSLSIMSVVASKCLRITSSIGSLCFQMSSYTSLTFCLSSSVLTLLHIFKYILYLNIWFKHLLRYFSSTIGCDCFPSAVPMMILSSEFVFMKCLILFNTYPPICPISSNTIPSKLEWS